MQRAFDLPLRRFTFADVKDANEYDFTLELAGLDASIAAPVVQAAVRKALNIDVVEEEILQDALVMKPASRTIDLLRPTASSATPQYAEVSDGKFVAFNSTVHDIAEALELYMGVPVIDETHVSGSFDAEFVLTSKEPSAVKDAVLKALGMRLEPEQRRVATFVVRRHGADAAQ